MKKERSEVLFDYVTIKTTKSRIDKGLLAIPVSLLDIFPKNKTKITVIDSKGNEKLNNFTPYNSSSRECRIGGMKNFYQKYSVQGGEELVIQILDDGKFKIVPEKIFKQNIIAIEKGLLDSRTDNEVDKKLFLLSKLTNKTIDEVASSEFLRLTLKKDITRKVRKSSSEVRTNIPPYIRKILLEIYKGRCQISNFTFLTKNKLPYFEIHHINPKGDHSLRNLLVVSPNIHAQFTYSKVKHFFDKDAWLRKVRFNHDEYYVRQAIDFVMKDYSKEVHFE